MAHTSPSLQNAVLAPVWPAVGGRGVQELFRGKTYHAVISKSHADTGRRAMQRPDLRASRIKAGVTSDARQVTSARSADRFQGLSGLSSRALIRRLFRAGNFRMASIPPENQPSQQVGAASMKNLEV